MKNILYISYDGMTDPLGQSQVLPYLKGLAKEGYKFHLLSFEKPEKFEQNKAIIQSICDENYIEWHPQKYTKKPPLLSTVKDVRKMKKVAYSLHKKHAFQIIHCRSYISALVGMNMKKKFGTKFIFDMRGFWADERVDGKIWSLKNPVFKSVYSFFKKKELQYFNHADHVISLTHNGKNEILSWKEFQHNPPKIQVIPCCVDLDLFNPSNIQQTDQDKLRNQLKIKNDDFILGYVGSIGTWYMLDEMLDYFKTLLLSKPTAKFLFVTGESPSFIQQKANEKSIEHKKIIVTSTLHSGVPLHISLFDISIFFIRPTYSKKASSPTKQGEIMAMGIPLICNSGVGDTDKIVKDYNSGYVLNELSVSSYKNLTISPNNFHPDDLMKGAKDYFSLEKGVKSYLEVYKSFD